MINIRVGKKLDVYNDREKTLKKYDYYFRAFKADIEYVRGRNHLGENIIHQHACELTDDYKNRTKRAIATPLIGSIIQKYNSIVFRNEPERYIDDEQILNNIDLKGNPINFFLSRVLLESQIINQAFVLLNYDGSEAASLAQQRAANSRFWWQHVPYKSVINYEKDGEGNLLWIIIAFKDYCQYFDDEITQIIYVDEKLNVKGFEEPVVHGYEGIPVSVCEPQFAYESQAAPLIDSQRKITNLNSLLDEETYSNIFTRWILSGADVDPEESGKLIMGSKRMMIIPDQATLTRMGSDISQSDALLKIIKEEEEKAYKLAGVKYDKASAESGLAKMIELESTYVIAETLSLALEKTENYLLFLMGWYEKTSYSRSFVQPDWQSEINQLRDLLMLDIGDESKENAIELFKQKFGI